MVQAQEWNAARYAREVGFVAALGGTILGWLAPRAGERILDLGCGDGALTEQIGAAGAVVVGVDSSPSMVAAARARGLDAQLGDGHALTFAQEFDAVFSNAALHWMTRPEAAVAGIARALRPGGRFVGEFGGHGNVAAILTALIAALNERGIDGARLVPWYYPTVAAYSALMEKHGFIVRRAELVARPTPLPHGMESWLGNFAGPFTRALLEAERPGFVARVCELLRPSLYDEQGAWTADYVRIRVEAGYQG